MCAVWQWFAKVVPGDRRLSRWVGLFVSFVVVVTLPNMAAADPSEGETAADEPVRVASVAEGDSAPEMVAAGVRALVSGEPVLVDTTVRDRLSMQTLFDTPVTMDGNVPPGKS